MSKINYKPMFDSATVSYIHKAIKAIANIAEKHCNEVGLALGIEHCVYQHMLTMKDCCVEGDESVCAELPSYMNVAMELKNIGASLGHPILAKTLNVDYWQLPPALENAYLHGSFSIEDMEKGARRWHFIAVDEPKHSKEWQSEMMKGRINWLKQMAQFIIDVENGSQDALEAHNAPDATCCS